MLLVLRQYHKPVGDSRSVSGFLILEIFFDNLPSICVDPLWRSYDFSDETVARDDVPLNNFTKIIEVLTADGETCANCSTWLLVVLLNVDVNKLLCPKLPSKSDVVLTSC
jgi:hypothetical protein